VITVTREGPFSSATTNATNVENNAEPAASPSSPSIRLKAFVIASTQRIVHGRPRYQGRSREPSNTGTLTIRRPPANKIAPQLLVRKTLHTGRRRECRHRLRAGKPVLRARE